MIFLTNGNIMAVTNVAWHKNLCLRYLCTASNTSNHICACDVKFSYLEQSSHQLQTSQRNGIVTISRIENYHQDLALWSKLFVVGAKTIPYRRNWPVLSQNTPMGPLAQKGLDNDIVWWCGLWCDTQVQHLPHTFIRAYCISVDKNIEKSMYKNDYLILSENISK